MVKLLILSDLHLDLEPMALDHQGQHIGANADLVILAGDIAEGHKGLRWARESFPDKPIIYVAGNHEFYGRHWGGHLRDMREKAQALDIAFLEDGVFEFGGLRFLGCSLWTDFELHGQ
jgi:predicted phosphodiesterase